MTTVAARLPAALARLSRSRDGALLGGVCSGLGRAARVDPTLVRLVFALLTFAGGAGVLAYAAGWIALPEDGAAPRGRVARIAGALLLAVAAVLTLRAVGIGDAAVWGMLLVAAGAFLALGGQRQPHSARYGLRVGIAITLLVTGVFVFVGASDESTDGSLVAPAGLAAVLFLVVGPWALRLARERDAERLERIRAQERADMAARVHDSVLQTLALVQREADDPRRVAALARRQERELRSWLYGERTEAGDTLRGELEEQLAGVEDVHGVRVEIVQTGDRPLDERLQALVLAAREAVTNAAVHAGVDEVSVFVEVEENGVAIFVRDRGPGFDRAAVPDDRRGIADSIEARLERHGGTAAVRSTPGEGTEVELRLPVAAA
jgi:signal transduction histidine kinase